MNLRIAGVSVILFAVFLQSCKLGYNRSKRPPSNSQTPPECAEPSGNVNLSTEAENVFQLLANLTCYSEVHNGNMVGQILGNGDRIASDDDEQSYAVLVDALTADHSHTPVVVDTNYEGDAQYGIGELLEVNTVLKSHWAKGGLVSVSWSPFNPWMTGEDASTAYSEAVNLEALLDQDSALHSEWRVQLDHVAEALTDLQTSGVAVLWRPFPEMNDGHYWWGINASADANDPESAELFINLWEDMHTYFTETHELNNLLWVYSPVDRDSTRASNAETAVWAYPGAETVDVVAPVVRVDTLQIREYEDLLDLGRPLALSSWSPTPTSSASREGTFDATVLSDRLRQSYPFIAYWLSPHSYGEPPNRSYLALKDLQNINDLFDRGHIFSLESAKEYELLSARGEDESE